MSDIDTPDDIPEITLGWRLRIAMERADLKAEDMADELGVHRGTISRWTHDIGSPPRTIYLHRWADLCRVPFGWLAGDMARPTVTAGGAGGRRFSNRVTTQNIGGCVTTTRRRYDSPSGIASTVAHAA